MRSQCKCHPLRRWSNRNNVIRYGLYFKSRYSVASSCTLQIVIDPAFSVFVSYGPFRAVAREAIRSVTHRGAIIESRSTEDEATMPRVRFFADGQLPGPVLRPPSTRQVFYTITLHQLPGAVIN
jgi:hypothetical protein